MCMLHFAIFSCMVLSSPPPYRPETSASMIDLPVSARDTNIVPVLHVLRSATTNDVNQESQASAGNPAVLEDNAVSEEDIDAQIVQPAMAYVIGLHAYLPEP